MPPASSSVFIWIQGCSPASPYRLIVAPSGFLCNSDSANRVTRSGYQLGHLPPASFFPVQVSGTPRLIFHNCGTPSPPRSYLSFIFTCLLCPHPRWLTCQLASLWVCSEMQTWIFVPLSEIKGSFTPTQWLFELWIWILLKPFVISADFILKGNIRELSDSSNWWKPLGTECSGQGL